MSVSIEQIQPGAVFQFKTAPRRVTSLGKPVGRGFDVNWEYADGKKRGGRLSGSQWVHYFSSGAIEQIPDCVKIDGSSALVKNNDETDTSVCICNTQIPQRIYHLTKWEIKK